MDEQKSISLPLSWIDKLFDQFALMYGDRFKAMWNGIDTTAVKQKWAKSLAGCGPYLQRALRDCESLPFPPTLPAFKNLCEKYRTSHEPMHQKLTLPPPVNALETISPERYKRIVNSIMRAFDGNNCDRNCRGADGKCTISQESQEFAMDAVMRMFNDRYRERSPEKNAKFAAEMATRVASRKMMAAGDES